MSAPQALRYIAPPAPPARVRLNKLKQLFLYEIKRDWKSRTATLVVFMITLGLLWHALLVRQPYLHLKQHQLTPNSLEARVQQLKGELAQINTLASEEALAELEKHIIQGYAGVSKLLEESMAQARKNRLLLTYSLDPPVPSHLRYFTNLSSIHVKVRLVPLDKVSSQQTWYNIMQQIHSMLAENKQYQLISLQINTNKQRVSQVLVSLSILAHLEGDH